MLHVAAARKLGIAVTNSLGAAAECVADAAWSLVLSTVRRTAMFDRMVRAGKWMPDSPILTDKVWGERIGIVGLGSIGKAIARRAEAFHMDIAYHGRGRQDGATYRYYDDLIERARRENPRRRRPRAAARRGNSSTGTSSMPSAPRAIWSISRAAPSSTRRIWSRR